ncbi:Zn-dependent membrane protease YugP [Solibacillus kalamii]|uniref:Predicted Zn-dependent protease n=3 Tax=Solibacillus TaxID=648800 RepID=F2F6S7_SOLSS|nr:MULTISPECIES: zinc metallopeptidase [Solibacillus]AMO84979.1 Zn-dependent protease [Solibacillus silvestris]EKB45965.1 Putative neutral zinc metallopeptidase [Solibacillus isronensis B3W22]MBM7666551.1 Zn-dependent membrane protease YugP [Solibacillus kalamii]OBW56522.1 Zn-dependent protease [Solibacillus silvestris]OUZ37862.1 Zn-dependent protease [Solibacillus kalamii]
MGLYIIYFIIILLLPLYAQMKVKSTYKKFAQVSAEKGMTGAQVARYILDQHGLTDVRVVPTQGYLADHYNPATKTVALSEDNYYNSSIAGTAVAAHEVGHAMQHAEAYSFLTLRSKLVPVANISSNMSWIFVMIGIFASSSGFLLLGIALLLAGVVFQVVTLPVEFDASKRAMNEVVSLGIINNTEERSARKVLNAAAMTYVAAAAVAVMELLRLILIYTGMTSED